MKQLGILEMNDIIHHSKHSRNKRCLYDVRIPNGIIVQYSDCTYKNLRGSVQKIHIYTVEPKSYELLV